MIQRKIVATSALPYANGDIHIGHLVEYLQTDFWARFQRMRGHDCIYVCADDTHGTPVMIRARREGISPEALIARSQAEHMRDFEDFEVAFDAYHSTHSEENRELSNLIFRRMESAGHIQARAIPQLYCPNDAMFLPDRFVRGTCPKCGAGEQHGDGCDLCNANYSVGELRDPACSICGMAPEKRNSEHLFFDINAFKDFLAEWIPAHTQRDVANKLLEWFNEDLRPWDISRDAPYFGFEIPGHPEKYFYVWLDAPIGYIATLKYLCKREGRDFESAWNGPDVEIVHFIGKDIVRFHCLFWPAMLRCAGFKTPDQVFVHGFLTVNGEKMSKSKGTFINARTYLGHLDAQYLRFYYACKLNGSTDDIDLNVADFVARVNADLVGKIVNLASRGAQMLHRSLDGRLGRLGPAGHKILGKAQSRASAVAAHYEARDFCRAITEVRTLAEEANRFFDAQTPWLSVKTDPEKARDTLTAVLNVFRVLSIYLAPVLPGFSMKVASLFGDRAPYAWADASTVIEDRTIAPYEYLARRVDAVTFEHIIEATRNARADKAQDSVARASGIRTEDRSGAAGSDDNPSAAVSTASRFGSAS